MRLAVTGAALPVLPDGYLVRSADDGDDLLGVHRAAWRPADLPFAPGCAPPFDPHATSSLTGPRAGGSSEHLALSAGSARRGRGP